MVLASLPGLPIERETCYTRKYLRGLGNLCSSEAYNQARITLFFKTIAFNPIPTYSLKNAFSHRSTHKPYAGTVADPDQAFGGGSQIRGRQKGLHLFKY